MNYKREKYKTYLSGYVGGDSVTVVVAVNTEYKAKFY